MTQVTSNQGMRPQDLFPLVRHLSHPLTLFLAPMPITPNQLTATAIVLGMSAAWIFTAGTYLNFIAGSILFILCYVLDNSDGELSRLKGQGSRFGARLDTFGDWLVHAAIFIGLGLGIERATGDALWYWLGIIAASGGTIDYFLGLFLDHYAPRGAPHDALSATPSPAPTDLKFMDRLIFIFRELTRADFCFIVAILAIFDLTWILLPLGALGAQIYWMTQFANGARDYHV